jgi:hypothetical protein
MPHIAFAAAQQRLYAFEAAFVDREQGARLIFAPHKKTRPDIKTGRI